MIDIRTLNLEGLEALCTELGWKSYRAKQLYTWVWQKDATGFDAMTNLSKENRTRLAARFRISELRPARTLEAADGTVKFTFTLDDGALIESVYIPDENRRTVCVSTQVGCPLGCRFCNTARMGLIRDLAWHEIAVQVQAVQRHVGRQLTNVVLMGMGEPFLNYEATVEAIRNVNSDFGINIGARRITVSTAGIPDAILRYARFPLQSKLALSLNAADDETRTELMPVNRKHPLGELIPAVREFTRIKGKRVTFEYVLIKGINDRRQDISGLDALLRGIPCKINLIPFNPFPGSDLEPTSPAAVERFAQALYPLLPAVTIRRSRGQEIQAACGQLAAQPD